MKRKIELESYLLYIRRNKNKKIFSFREKNVTVTICDMRASSLCGNDYVNACIE